MTRLTSDQKEAALACCAHWMTDATLVRLGQRWGIVGRYLDDNLASGKKDHTWIGRLVVAVDDLIPELTYTAQVLGSTRRSVIEQLTAS